MIDKAWVSVRMIPMKPKETIAAFDAYLADRGLEIDAVVIGGAALGLLGIVSRQTRDCDILHPSIAPTIAEAAREFASLRRRSGDPLDDDWLDNGPSSLADVLPAAWPERLRVVYQGIAITLRSLGRLDLLRSKLFALCDRGLDLEDCVALAPTAAKLAKIVPWLEEQDANPDWPAHTRAVLNDLRRRLKHGI